MISQDFLQGLQTFGLAFVPALFGIICHEVAHGWVAYKQGDPTAKALGRLTLNPISHIDPVGFGVFAVTALTSPFIIGWAKPVPVQPRYFKRPREGMMLVSIAGPVANLLVAFLCALILKLSSNLVLSGIAEPSTAVMLLRESAGMGMWINCSLAWFNLMPVPPLDGSHIVSGLLPRDLAYKYESIGRYGMIIVVVLIASGVVGKVLPPIISQTVRFISMLAGL